MANLMGYKIEEEFGFYLAAILPQQVKRHKGELISAYKALKEQYEDVLESEGDLNEFVEKVIFIIRHKDASPEELEGLKPKILEKFDLVHSIDYPELFRKYSTTESLFDELNRVKKTSLIKFQNANRPQEHTSFWNSQNISLEDIQLLLTEVKKRKRMESSKSKILGLLDAITQRIEQERIEHRNSDIARMNDDLINAIKTIGKAKEFVRVKQELESVIEPLAEKLIKDRHHFRFSQANRSSLELEHEFTRHYNHLSQYPHTKRFLSRQDLKQIHDTLMTYI